MKKFDERVVIVLDNGNCKSSYAEKCPFKAIVKDVYEREIAVTSITTGQEYELYYSQILETMEIDEIKYMLSGGEYGGYDDSKLVKQDKFFK